jgi:membrane associated rhomboid family serine protease
MKITCDSPVTIFFGLACVAATACITLLPSSIYFFSAPTTIQFLSPSFYLKLFLHVIGHADWSHLYGNIFILLLLSPAIETRIGGRKLILLLVIVALATGLLNALFFSSALLGASGVVFALIMMTAAVDVKKGTIPLAFLAVVLLYLGKELFALAQPDRVSQFAHIFGGIVGIFFAYRLAGKKRSR